jgi:hypothetical protein
MSVYAPNQMLKRTGRYAVPSYSVLSASSIAVLRPGRLAFRYARRKVIVAYERTINGNPQQLTIDQHFHTAHAISKFYNEVGKVEVKLLCSGEIVDRHNRAKIFCTKRTWDQRAEVGYMASIENAFHQQIDEIPRFSERDHEALSRYFLLWRFRFAYHMSPLPDVLINGNEGSSLTKSQEEVLERKGYMYVRDGGVVPSRFNASMQIQIELDRVWDAYKDLKWGLLEAMAGEFLVADSYKDQTCLPFMPIAPKLAFAASVQDKRLTRIQVSQLNQHSVSNATEFLFGQRLSECPVA